MEFIDENGGGPIRRQASQAAKNSAEVLVPRKRNEPNLFYGSKCRFGNYEANEVGPEDE